MPPPPLPTVNQPLPKFVVTRSRISELVASSGPRAAGSSKAAGPSSDEKVPITAEVPYYGASASSIVSEAV